MADDEGVVQQQQPAQEGGEDSLRDAFDRLRSNDRLLVKLDLSAVGYNGVETGRPKLNRQDMDMLVASLQENSCIRRLCLLGCLADDPDIIEPLAETVLSNHPSLIYVELWGNKLRDTHVSWIADALRCRTCRLQKIYLSSNLIGDTGIRVLCDAIIENTLTKIRTVVLNDNRFGDAGLRALASLLSAAHVNLQAIGVSALRQLTSGAFHAFSRSVQHHRSLQQLGLTGFTLADPTLSFRPFLEVSLPNLSRLTHLHLCGNNLGDLEASLIANALPKLSIGKLDLRSNSIGDSGIRELAKSLRRSKSLQILFLTQNRFGTDGADDLISSLECNCKITHISVEGNDGLPEAQRNRLAELCRSNKNAYKACNRICRERHDIEVPLLPHALQCISQKPSFLYSVVRTDWRLWYGESRNAVCGRQPQRQQQPLRRSKRRRIQRIVGGQS